MKIFQKRWRSAGTGGQWPFFSRDGFIRFMRMDQRLTLKSSGREWNSMPVHLRLKNLD